MNRVWACKWVISRINYCMLQTINIIFIISVIIIVINKTLLKINLQWFLRVAFKTLQSCFMGSVLYLQPTTSKVKKRSWSNCSNWRHIQCNFHLLSTYSQTAARILFPEFELSNSTWFCYFICTTRRLLAVHLVLDYNQHGKITLYTIRRPWGLLISTAVTNLHRKILMNKSANTAPKKWWTSTPLPDHTS